VQFGRQVQNFRRRIQSPSADPRKL
jgi:hypothetical protein